MPDDQTAPLIARPKPYYCELAAGATYLWCACGRSRTQPFCDGSHRETPFKPVSCVARRDGEEVLFCGCKRTGTPPYCDGAHNNLPGAYREDDPDSEQNRRVTLIDRAGDGIARLDGRCYVWSPVADGLDASEGGRLALAVGAALGAEHQSLHVWDQAERPSPVLAFGSSHVVLFVSEGAGVVTISGRPFPLDARTGVYVRPGEALQVWSHANRPMRLYASAGPPVSTPARLGVMPTNFDATCPMRTVGLDPRHRQRMAVRFFQMLVDRSVGSTYLTQFIGSIPESKAEPHRHLYEEALLILSGRGMMWTETRKARVEPGDVIFFPRKQLHSLQCCASEGMEVVGVILPGDNPSVNY